MANHNNTLSAETLRQIVHYDSGTGVFTRLLGTRKGQIAGTSSDTGGKSKRRLVWVQGKQYKAHRLAWLYMTGAWPDDEIDHIDGDSLNNRWENLRVATHQENRSNNRAYRNNRLGVRGVQQRSNGRYRAYIAPSGRMKSLGDFATLEEAKATRQAAERKYFGAFAHDGE